MKLAFTTTTITGLSVQLLQAIPTLDRIWTDLLGYELIITYGLDGVHSDFSSHYSGNAIDGRTWRTPRSGEQISDIMRAKLVAKIKDELGENFQVIGEGTHIHIAFRPRKRAWTTV